jgi:3-oxoadipate enol-lactonase
MGGLIAMSLAIRAPDRIRSLVVASAAARLTPHGRRSLSLMRDLVTHLPARRVGRALMSLTFAPPFQTRFPGFVDEAAALYGLDPDDVPGALGQLEHLLDGWDLRQGLGAAPAPTLAVAGTRDPIVAVEDTAEIAGCLDNAELLEVPDAGHSVLAEGGAAVLKRVTEQLRA